MNKYNGKDFNLKNIVDRIDEIIWINF
jgi:hypothetical protein